MALPVTAAAYDAPWQTQMVRIGRRGLNLAQDAASLHPEDATLYTNAVHHGDGRIVSRPGQGSLLTAAGSHHSHARLNNPRLSTFTRYVGVGTGLHVGTAGPLGAAVDSGYSGDPLTFLRTRPTISGDPWMLAADRSRVRMVREDGVVATLGLNAPTLAAAIALDTARTVPICEFDASDGTEAATWTPNAGLDDSGVVTGVPTQVDGGGISGNAVEFRSEAGAAAAAYYNFWNHTLALNLSQYADGRAADDDDLIHLWLKVSEPENVVEVRLYFVVDAGFDTATLPGTDPAALANRRAYVATWTQSDIAAFITGGETQPEASAVARIRALSDEAAARRAIGQVRNRPLRDDEEPYSPTIADKRESWALRRAQIDPARALARAAGAGRHEWIEYGVVGIPLRRGDFQRIGPTDSGDWSTVTGVVVFIKVAAGTGLSVALDDCYLTGGSGPDTAEPGAAQLDYRYTYYHTLT